MPAFLWKLFHFHQSQFDDGDHDDDGEDGEDGGGGGGHRERVTFNVFHASYCLSFLSPTFIAHTHTHKNPL